MTKTTTIKPKAKQQQQQQQEPEENLITGIFLIAFEEAPVFWPPLIAFIIRIKHGRHKNIIGSTIITNKHGKNI